jgi:hypothetical protein
MSESNKTGHYQRLRKRFLSGEPGSQSDEVILELILTYSIGRKDVKPVVEELLLTFGALSKVVGAPVEELRNIKGVGESSLTLFKVINHFRSDFSPPEESAKPAEVIPGEPQSAIEPVPEQPQVESIRDSNSSQSLARSNEPGGRRKFQICNGYLLEFDQLARVLHFLLENKDAKKISRASLQESTGLAERQVASIISMGAALGLIQPGRQTLTRIGMLIAENDIFLEKRGTLEWCHYVAAGSHRNLIWFEVFNRLLAQDSPMTQKGWCQDLRSSLTGQYTDRTIGKHLHQEVRFLVDAYLERNFRKLELLHQTSEGLLYRRRYTDFEPLVLSAMIYDFGAESKTQLLQVNGLAAAPGSPALLFGLDTATFRSLVEDLHERGLVRYETTHNLDQIRLKPSVSAFELLSAHFEGRSVREEASAKKGGLRG